MGLQNAQLDTSLKFTEILMTYMLFKVGYLIMKEFVEEQNLLHEKLLKTLQEYLINMRLKNHLNHLN